MEKVDKIPKVSVKSFSISGRSTKELFAVSSSTAISKQLQTDPFEGDYKEGNIIEPPYSLSGLCYAYELSPVLAACINAMYQNVLGFGHEIILREGVEADDKEAPKEEDLLEEYLDQINPHYSFKTLLKLYYIDKETTGGGSLEVLRNTKGGIGHLIHAPNTTIRIRADKKNAEGEVQQQGYVQQIGLKKVYFKNFEDTRTLNCETGEYKETENKEANELIYSKIYAPRSRYYGIARYVSAGPAIKGNYYAQQTDNAYFKNGCFIGKVLIITNGALSESATHDIQKYLNSLKGGVENAHKILVISIEEPGDEEVPTLGKVKKPDVEFKDLNDKSELGFEKFEDRNDQKIRTCFRLPKMFLGHEKEINRATAEIYRTFAEEQIFQPIRLEEEELFNKILCGDFKKVKIRFKPLSTGSSVEQAREDKDRIVSGSRVVDDLRERDGKNVFDKWWSRIPVAIAEKLLEDGYPPTGTYEEIFEKAVEKGGGKVFFYDQGQKNIQELVNNSSFIKSILKVRDLLQKKIREGG